MRAPKHEYHSNGIKDYLYFNQQNNNALTSLAPKPIGKRQEYQYQREGELFR